MVPLCHVEPPSVGRAQGRDEGRSLKQGRAGVPSLGDGRAPALLTTLLAGSRVPACCPVFILPRRGLAVWWRILVKTPAAHTAH